MTTTAKDFRANVVDLFRTIKERSKEEPQLLPILDPATGVMLGRLRHIPECPPGTINEDIRLLAEWRDAVNEWFPAQFKVTFEGTRSWYSNLVIGRDDRILFMVETVAGQPVGHVGLSSFNFEERTCEIDNLIRGVGKEGVFPGAMTLCMLAIAKWAYDFLKVESTLGRVFSDNVRTLACHGRCGFVELGRVPLRRVVEGDVTNWVEAPDMPAEQAERSFITDCLPKSAVQERYAA